MMYLPSATYRVQLNADFRFSNLQDILEYLHQLGVSTIYVSPISAAVKGSTHGYDVTDPEIVNPEIGTEDELREINGLLKSRNMGWLQDIVPNHMALSPENPLLMDVLERGPVSNYYEYFDIAWNYPASKGKLILFVLPEAKPDMQKLKLELTDTGFYMSYDGQQYPLALPSYPLLTGYLLLFGGSEKLLKPLVTLNTRISRIPDSKVWKKYKTTIFRTMLKDPEAGSMLKVLTEKIDADKNLLRKLLNLQYYVPKDYHEADRMINYRRFFTINTLICLRMEKQSVYSGYHKMLKRFYKQGYIQGLRIDHLDGLADPGRYLRNLRRSFGNDCYIVAEKITGNNETLPGSWPIQGTTGYDFITQVQQLFTVKDGMQLLKSWYNKSVTKQEFEEETVNNRMKILKQYMHGEWDNLYNLFAAEGFFTARGKWKEALGAWMCSMPVYRIYPPIYPLRPEEKQELEQTTSTALSYFPALKKEIELLSKWFMDEEKVYRERILPLMTRLMQFTGPLMAKGIEDTSFYTWNVLIARNEVGDAPDRVNDNRQELFHQSMLQRLKFLPHSLNATATHDTKRGEDARVRLLAITENPAPWLKLIDSWFGQNDHLLKIVNRKMAPSRNDQYFIYQSIVGAYPADGFITKDWLERLQQCILKAIREAKQNTSWDKPADIYEQACGDFISGLLRETIFLRQLKSFMKKLDAKARVYSLSQLLLKLTCPGIPDIYQGTELYDYSFVDPDNRRAVDFETRKRWSDEIIEKKKLDSAWWELQVIRGSDKLFVCMKTLAFRKMYPQLFSEGEYIPLDHTGDNSRLSFARKWNNRWMIISCPIPGWQPAFDQHSSIVVPDKAPKIWINLFSGKQLKTADLNLNVSAAAGNMDAVLLLLGTAG